MTRIVPIIAPPTEIRVRFVTSLPSFAKISNAQMPKTRLVIRKMAPGSPKTNKGCRSEATLIVLPTTSVKW